MAMHRMRLRAAFEKMAQLVALDAPKEEIVNFARHVLDLDESSRDTDPEEDFGGLPTLWPDHGDKMHIGVHMLGVDGEMREVMVEDFHEAIDQLVRKTVADSGGEAEDVAWCLVLDSRDRGLNQVDVKQDEEEEDPYKWS